MQAYALRDKQANTVANAFLDFVCRYGCPEHIVSDRGTEFTSCIFKEITSLLSCKLHFTSSYHPQSNGMTEAFNKLLKNTLFSMVQNDVRTWDAQLPCAVLALNCSYHPSIKNIPFFLFYGRPPPLQYSQLLKNDVLNYSLTDDSPACVQGRLRKAFAEAYDASKQATELNQKYRKPTGKPFAEADIVFLRNDAAKRGPYSKFKPCWLGPFSVSKRINEVNYEIVPITSRGPSQIVHWNRLKAGKMSEGEPFLGLSNDKMFESRDILTPLNQNTIESEIESSDDEVVLNIPPTTRKNNRSKNTHPYALRSKGPVENLLL